MKDCLFCRMIAGDIPVTPVYDDQHLMVIEDIHPQAPLHVLVIPKTHIASLNDLSPDHDPLIGSMFRRAAAIARDRGYAERGFRTRNSRSTCPRRANRAIRLCTVQPRGERWASG